MANFTSPSFTFSLGLDLDDDLHSKPGSSFSLSSKGEEEVGDVVSDTPPDSPVPVLKRLKRGPRDHGGAVAVLPTSGSLDSNCLDDEIEEFSQEDTPVTDFTISTQNHSVCSAKLSLHGSRVLTTQSARKLNLSNGTPSLNSRLMDDPEISSNKMMLPMLTISPIRKIHFIESDTDQPSPKKEIKKHCNKKPDIIYGQVDGENDYNQKEKGEKGHNHTETEIHGQIRTNYIFPVNSSTENLSVDSSRLSVKFPKLPSNGKSASAVSMVGSEINCSRKMLPKLTDNPLQRFTLLDIDADDPTPLSDTKEGNKEINGISSSSLVISKDSETNSNKKILPKSTMVPLQRIQLQNSDPSHFKERKKDNNDNNDRRNLKGHTETKCFEKDIWHRSSPIQCHAKLKALSDKCTDEGLWKDFCSKKSVNFATPALDEFCKEYFSSLEGSCAGQSERREMSINNSTIQKGDCPVILPYMYNSSVWDSGGVVNNAESRGSLQDPQPPFLRYFFHNDLRIQKLVRERFINFVPLSTQLHGENQHREAEFVDYMCQFNSKKDSVPFFEVSNSASRKNSRSKKKNQMIGNAEEAFLSSGKWVNQGTGMPHPKSSGRKKGHGGGHWYTAQDGRKVYVNKNGQELMGRVAYQHYYKESGGKAKKKLGTRKKKAKR